MAKVLPIRLLSRLPLPCWSRPHLARTSSRPASRPSLLVRTFATTSSLARPAEDAAPTKAHITARGVTQSRPPEQRAEVRVEGATLVRAGEATSARRAADVGDVDAARHDPTDDATGSAADRTDSYSRRRRVDGTLSASPVALSEEQDPTLGHLTSTSTHLLRLTLPLPSPDQPVSFVLHPAQPLSYLSRLIAAELPSSLPDVEVVHYRGFGEDGRWSEATDLADFLRQSANIKAFEIDLLPAARRSSNDSNIEHPKPLKSIKVLVPSFLSRTRYLRDRLDQVNDHLREMADLKAECDRLAKQGARRVALGGLGGLVAYWGAVAVRLFRHSFCADLDQLTYRPLFCSRRRRLGSGAGTCSPPSTQGSSLLADYPTNDLSRSQGHHGARALIPTSVQRGRADAQLTRAGLCLPCSR